LCMELYEIRRFNVLTKYGVAERSFNVIYSLVITGIFRGSFAVDIQRGITTL